MAVAGRTLMAVEAEFANAGVKQKPLVNIAVVSIMPNPDGNPNSFVDAAKRVLNHAIKKGDGQIAFADKKGKIGIHTQRSDDLELHQDVG